MQPAQQSFSGSAWSGQPTYYCERLSSTKNIKHCFTKQSTILQDRANRDIAQSEFLGNTSAFWTLEINALQWRHYLLRDFYKYTPYKAISSTNTNLQVGVLPNVSSFYFVQFGCWFRPQLVSRESSETSLIQIFNTMTDTFLSWLCLKYSNGNLIAIPFVAHQWNLLLNQQQSYTRMSADSYWSECLTHQTLCGSKPLLYALIRRLRVASHYIIPRVWTIVVMQWANTQILMQNALHPPDLSSNCPHYSKLMDQS